MSGRGDDRIEAPPLAPLPADPETATELAALRREVVALQAKLASARYILQLLVRDL